MVFGYDNEPMPINFFGGLSINNVDGNGTVQIGESLWQSITSNTKLNVTGQVFGYNNYANIQPVGSPIIDPDGIDTPSATSQIPYGLED